MSLEPGQVVHPTSLPCGGARAPRGTDGATALFKVHGGSQICLACVAPNDALLSDLMFPDPRV